jgi:hypothetical protein
MNQLYTLNIGRRIYWSMSTAEIAAFAIFFGLVGQAEEAGTATFFFEGVICVEQ